MILVFIVCAAIVGGVAWYVKSSHKVDGTAIQEPETVVGTTYDYKVAPQNTDWRKQFLASSTESIRFAGDSGKPTLRSEPLTVTDQLGINMFMQYWTAKQSGLEKDPQVVSSITEKFVGGVGGLIPGLSYDESDLKIGPDSDFAALERYAQSTFSSLGKIPQQDAATIAKDAFDNDDMEILKQIDAIVSSYDKILGELGTTVVPAPLVQNHLDLINGIAIALENAKAIRIADKDPARSLAAISNYMTGYEKISSAVSGIDDYYSSRGILLRAENK